ncbi:MAG: NCS2 family permease [Polyangia bacterium]
MSDGNRAKSSEKSGSGPKSGPVSIRREILAGVTTFVTMSYIVVVNPDILSASGMPRQDIFFATCAASAAATIVMALWARYPFALAPGMGLNAFFAFTVCGEMGIPWSTALAGVLLSGVVFAVLSLFGLRERLIATVPKTLVRAVTAGIGLFIAFIGLQKAGLVVDDEATLVALGDLGSPAVIAAAGGLVITVALLAAKLPGAILIGIAATWLLAAALGAAGAPEGLAACPSLPSETLGAAVFGLSDLLRPEMITVVFTMLFLDLFDTMGTLMGLGYTSGYLREDGSLPRARRAFFSDSVGTMVGSLLGTSTVTTYIESATGVVAGGRSGLTALVVAALFLLALPFYPLIEAVPSFATAPALFGVGALMFRAAADIDWKDAAEAIPALGAILAMPATYNISNGLGIGFILFAVTQLATRRRVGAPVYVIAVLFLGYFAMDALG